MSLRAEVGDEALRTGQRVNEDKEGEKGGRFISARTHTHV